MVAYLIWDLGGVVFRYHPERRLERLTAASALNARQVDQAIFGSGLSEDADRGVHNATQFAAEARTAAKLTLDDRELRDVWAEAFVPDDEVVALLRAVRPEVHQASLSNNSQFVDLVMTLHWPHVMERFMPQVWSYEVGAMKPDPTAFVWVDRLLGLAPEEICFIDDGEANVAAAREHGWDAIHFSGADVLRGELSARGLLAD